MDLRSVWVNGCLLAFLCPAPTLGLSPCFRDREQQVYFAVLGAAIFDGFLFRFCRIAILLVEQLDQFVVVHCRSDFVVKTIIIHQILHNAMIVLYIADMMKTLRGLPIVRSPLFVFVTIHRHLNDTNHYLNKIEVIRIPIKS